ncbi:polysaccharide pyruvyl transferase family protein [Bacteroides nordii]|uniref:Polysaccharide pyruvyl transferase family protein n=1 Tax=Bacteroides nordii TaxID=291645 RepID=A0A413V772_9BACE|nr:polysaccharide pyruvyl transferase family protein [Bacteroides nordii]RHB29416.1 polysaccharide pyruvyl transferase family protein [Bacteroides nordii]
MKKISTLTTQFANNQGAILQCYALQHFLSNVEGVECQVIDYFPKGSEQSWKVLPHPNNLKMLLKNIYTLFNLEWVIGKKQKSKVMRQFIKDYIVTTPKKYDRNAIVANPPKADYYICGSDQIWNFVIFDDMTYYFDFVDKVPGAKRIAYAASLSDPWNEEQGKKVSSLLEKFSELTIREAAHVPLVQKYVPSKRVKWVCDPVFLLPTDEWDKIATDPNEIEPYILCYFLNIDSKAVEFVNKMKNLTGYKVINLVLSSREKFKSDKLVHAYTPKEFVGYIKHASFIITNSFHCSAFSSMYKKNFRFIPKSWANERLVSLEELFGYKVIMTQEMINKFTVEDMPLDYSKAGKMDDFIAQSKKYLLHSIDER